MAGMTVTTTRLVLRRPSEADLKAIFEVHSDPETNVHNPAGPMTEPSEAVLRLEEWTKGWLEDGYGYWTVALADAPETVIGFGGVMRKQITPELFDNNLYFRFRPEAWGQGYAGEMVEAALTHTFGELAQERIFGMTRPHNTVSRKTLEQAGFRYSSTAEATEDAQGDEPSVLYLLERRAFGDDNRNRNVTDVFETT